MKKFSQFISEAKESLASQKAKQMGLKGDGHGGWYNASGEFVAKTESGDLKFYTKGQKPGKDVPLQQQKKPQKLEVSVQQEPEKRKKGGKKLTVVFGRFNPPTKGHLQLFTSAKSVAGGSDLKIYPSRSQDSEKNPLAPDSKIEFMKKMFPKFENNIINDINMITIFDVLQGAENDGYKEVTVVVGSDRLSEFRSLALKHNGSLYNFNDITVVAGGERDSDTETSSKLRQFASQDDFRGFKTGLPKTLSNDDSEKLFKLVKKGMKISSKNENVDLWKIAPKLDYINLREKYINEKIFKTGTIVESLNTGLSGKVIRRGTNYLICVTEDDVMFKSWIKDVTEVHEVENPSKNLRQLVQKAKKRQDNNIDGFSNNEDQKVGPYGAFIPQARNFGTNFKKLRSESKRFTDVSGVPADQREVGTDSLRKYAMKMAQVKNIQNFINKYKKNKVST